MRRDETNVPLRRRDETLPGSDEQEGDSCGEGEKSEGEEEGSGGEGRLGMSAASERVEEGLNLLMRIDLLVRSDVQVHGRDGT